MSLRLSRGAAVALVVALGLAAIPACGKSKKTQPAPDAPNPTPNPSTGPNTGPADPAAPTGPFFRGSDPRTAAARITSEANMKEIVIALHNFESANGALPAGIADKTGKPGLSWRVAVLPYLEQNNLYNQFKRDEPWDSEHNKKFISMMPKVFAPPNQSTNGYTFSRGFTGPDTWLPPARSGAPAAQPGQALLGAKFAHFTGGSSNKFLVVEAGDAVVWTKPDEIQFAPGSVPKLGGVFDTGFVAGMADGSVKFVRKGPDPKSIASAIQLSDGGIVDFDR